MRMNLLPFLAFLALVSSSCGSSEKKLPFQLHATFNMEDGSTYLFDYPGVIKPSYEEKLGVWANDSDRYWEWSMSIILSPEVVTTPGTYDIIDSGILVFAAKLGGHEPVHWSGEGSAGQITFVEVGYEPGDTWNASFDRIDLELYEDNWPDCSPIISLSEGSIAGTMPEQLPPY